MEIQNNKLLLVATVVIVVFSAMCLEGLLGTNLSLNAERRGDTDTFDVSASFTALDDNGTAMAGATVRCSGTGGFSKSGTTDSQGAWSFTEAFSINSGDCPKKTIEMSCHAEKGSMRTTTESGSVELWCKSETSNPEFTSTPTVACNSGCKADGAAGGACSSIGVISPRCCADVESAYKSQVTCSANQTVSWMASTTSKNYNCGTDKECFCYTLETCDEECKLGKCTVPTACQAKGVTGDVACSTLPVHKTCVSSTCGGGCADYPAADGPCGCTATCK